MISKMQEPGLALAYYTYDLVKSSLGRYKFGYFFYSERVRDISFELPKKCVRKDFYTVF